jgi:ketosteroid isomerase-like protein
MSEENVEIVRRGYRAFDSGDVSGALDAFHPTPSFDG